MPNKVPIKIPLLPLLLFSFSEFKLSLLSDLG